MAVASSSGEPSICYFAVLGLNKEASSSDVRIAYHKLAKIWHPDKWTQNSSPSATEEANRRFQTIQEAYSVLSNETKRSMYDCGLYDPLEEHDEEFFSFIEELTSMKNNSKDEGDSFEDLQKMFFEIVGDDAAFFDVDRNVETPIVKPPHVAPVNGS